MNRMGHVLPPGLREAAPQGGQMQMARKQHAIRVLVVEDDPIFQGLLRGWLADGYEVVLAGTMAEARRHAEAGAFDLVILDLNLPDSTGLASLEALHEAIRGTPVVVLTSEEDEGQGLAAVRQGAQDYVQKSTVAPDVLKRDLLYAVERRRLEDLHQRALRHELEARRLREIDQAKNRFYQAAARGLRDPIQPLRFGIQMLQLELQSSLTPSQRDTLDSLHRHVEHLDRLAADLVDMAAIQTQSLELDRHPTDLRRVAARSVEAHRERAEAQRVNLRVQAKPDAVVDGDPQRLAQVLDHLLENAIRHTPAGGSVTLRVRQEGDRAVVDVEDSGAGLAAARIPSLTEAFPTGEEGETRGVGLALSKGIVEHHGGTLRLFSRGEGQGTTARVVLPILGST